MKVRASFVSNSSSSSFILNFKPVGVKSVKLNAEITEVLRKHAHDWDGKPLAIPEGKELYLTEQLYDESFPNDEIEQALASGNGCCYIDGDGYVPHGFYDNEKDYTVLASGDEEFYLANSDLTGGVDGLPASVALRNKIREVLASKMPLAQKLGLIQSIVH